MHVKRGKKGVHFEGGRKAEAKRERGAQVTARKRKGTFWREKRKRGISKVNLCVLGGVIALVTCPPIFSDFVKPGLGLWSLVQGQDRTREYGHSGANVWVQKDVSQRKMHTSNFLRCVHISYRYNDVKVNYK